MIEKKIYELLSKRGYGVDTVYEFHYIKQQVLKGLEELGEVARHVFDGENPPAEEVADVIIPMAAICAVLGYDLEEEVVKKASGDISRGIRNAFLTNGDGIHTNSASGNESDTK